MTTEKNGLLARLTAQDRALLAPHLEPVALNQKDVIHEPHQPLEHVYFLEDGLSSEIAINPDGQRIEVGCIGREGFTGVPAVLGIDSTPHHAFMEVGGSALRVGSAPLNEAMAASPALRTLLLRYVHVFMIQIAATALADGRYPIHKRLARWLLMCQDRLGRDELPLTHEFLSLMLGVRRSGVTDAIHVLEGDGIIKAQRGLITVRKRPALETAAGDSYGLPETEYRRLIGEF